MSEEPTGQRKGLRAGGIKRRKQILEATLRVILRDGIRGVRHRAVALEAKVPLASTTYYFKDLEELLSETFLFWNHGATIYLNGVHEKLVAHINSDTPGHIKDPQVRVKQAEVFSSVAIVYVLDLIENHRDDRVIELAFHHEATRNSQLRHVVRQSLNKQRAGMEQLYQSLGSSSPQADAQVTMSLLLRLEQDAVMEDAGDYSAKVRRVLRRHIEVMFLAAAND